MPAGGFRDYVESVRSALDIVQVVGEAVTLRKAGRSLVGLCPFHQEKTPSFHVDQAKGVYYCFGCGAGGDAFKFVMNYHQIEFPEAVAFLGDRLGIARPAPASAQEAQEDRQRRRVLEALAKAQEFFAGRLGAPDGSPVREYLDRRGLTLERARHFGLGFAPPGWDGLLKALVSRSFDVDTLVRAGLVVPRTGADGVYDRFRNRLTFPIRDSAGRVVSFGGRALGDDEPKYLNGPETSVYDKSRTLFRLHEASAELRSSRRAVVVEGYFDAVSLAAVGTAGVVAVCGTSFGSAHARILRRYADSVVLLFDGDPAGRSAAQRAIGPLLAEGLAVRVATPPDGKDPDDLAREGGLAAVEACVGAALDLPHYLVMEAKRNFDLVSIEGRVKALEMVLGHLTQLDSPLARAEAAGRVAEGLGLEDNLVRDELRRAARERRPRMAATRRPAAPALTHAEIVLIRYLGGPAHQHREEAANLLAEIPLDSLGPLAREAVERWTRAQSAGELLTLRRLAEAVGGDEAPAILALAFGAGPDPDLAAARGALSALREAELKGHLRSVQERIQQEQDPVRLEDLMREKLELARHLQGLASGTPVTVPDDTPDTKKRPRRGNGNQAATMKPRPGQNDPD